MSHGFNVVTLLLETFVTYKMKIILYSCKGLQYMQLVLVIALPLQFFEKV